MRKKKELKKVRDLYLLKDNNLVNKQCVLFILKKNILWR